MTNETKKAIIFTEAALLGSVAGLGLAFISGVLGAPLWITLIAAGLITVLHVWCATLAVSIDKKGDAK